MGASHDCISHRIAAGLQEGVSQDQVFQEACAEATRLLMT